MHTIKIILLILLILLLLFFIVSWIMSNVVLKKRKISHKEAFQWEHDHNNISDNFENSMPQEAFTFKSPRGYSLYGKWLFPNKEIATQFKNISKNNNSPSTPNKEPFKVIILSHGHGSCISGMYKYASMYLPKGYICLVYDHVHEGISEGKYITMGKFESLDLEDIVTKVLNIFGKNTKIGIHGESMGSATAIIHHSRDSRISFTVADCPYADLNNQLGHSIKHFYHLPTFPLLQISSLIAKIRAGYFWSEVSPISELIKAGGVPNTPLMLVHGTADDFVPCESSKDLFEVKEGIKKLYLVPEAVHAHAYITNPEEYKKQLYEFLNEIKF